jgi:hypothetical protein
MPKARALVTHTRMYWTRAPLSVEQRWMVGGVPDVDFRILEWQGTCPPPPALTQAGMDPLHSYTPDFTTFSHSSPSTYPNRTHSSASHRSPDLLLPSGPYLKQHVPFQFQPRTPPTGDPTDSMGPHVSVTERNSSVTPTGADGFRY